MILFYLEQYKNTRLVISDDVSVLKILRLNLYTSEETTTMASVTAEDIKSELDTFNIAFTNETVDKSKAMLLVVFSA